MEGNQQKMREALYDIVMLTMKVWYSIHGDVACGIIASKAKHALSALPRQCDVGTAEEQAQRFAKFCKKSSMSGFGALAYCAYDCPCRESADCKFAWAQMPYEEERKGETDGR